LYVTAPNVVYNAKEATSYPPVRGKRGLNKMLYITDLTIGKLTKIADMTAAPGVITKKQKEHVIDMEKPGDFVEEPLHSPQSVAPRTEKAMVSTSVRTRKGRVPSLGKIDLKTTVKSYSVASLQQYTNSFSEQNLIRDSRFGRVYLAELPDGEVQTVYQKHSDCYFSKIVLVTPSSILH
jgi:hypothetical protein